MLRHHPNGAGAPILCLLLLLLLSPVNSPALSNEPKRTAPAAAPQTQTAAVEIADPVERIKDEALNRSQVMSILSYLTDVIGPRLTASPNMKRANNWTRDKLSAWGLEKARLEPWGLFGRGWSLRRFSAAVTEPQVIPLIAYPKAWSPGTDGQITGNVIHLDAVSESELNRFRGRLKGAIVLNGPRREIKAHFEPQGTRLSDKELLALADAPAPPARPRRRSQQTPEQIAASNFAQQKLRFLTSEGAAVIVEASRIGDGGTIFVGAAAVPQPAAMSGSNGSTNDADAAAAAATGARQISAWDTDAPRIVPQIVIDAESYNRMVRMLAQGEKLRMTVDLAVQYHDEDLKGYNTIAEIPGTDLKNEVVMLGGHLDSWHAGTGATDNAAGVAVGMEAVRILQELKLRPRRTIRIALWSGEEQGLLGSLAYVNEHLAVIGDGSLAAARAALRSDQPPKFTPKPGYDKFSVYFNLDNGTGKIRGVYLQGNDAVRPVFRRWLAPFRQLGASTLSIANTGGTDHLSFDLIGLPGFQFIQDEIEYETRTHHSNQDVFDRIQPEDMKQAAAVMTAFVYQAAMADNKIPRKDAESPQP